MTQCNFCGNEINKGKGTMFVRKTGRILYFCGSKCEKNSTKLKRKAPKFKWTNEFRKQKKTSAKKKA